MEPELLFLNLEIGKWNAIVTRQFEGFIKRGMKDYDLTYNELFFLMGIGTGDIITDKEHFVESLCIDQSTATRNLKALECKGLVKMPKVKKPTAADFWKVTLTARGQKAQQAGQKLVQIWIEIAFKDMDLEAQTQLLEINRLIARNILSVTSPTTIMTGKLPQ